MPQTRREKEGENAGVTTLCLSGAPSTTLIANLKERSLEEVFMKHPVGKAQTSWRMW